MFPLVRLSLSCLRVAVQASLFIEAQRLLLRLLRPHRRNHLVRAEAHVLRSVRSSIRHRFLLDNHNRRIHILQLPYTIHEKRPVAVLLHGHSMSAAFWTRNFDDLVALGFQVFAIDLLGWGRSERPRFDGKTVEHCLDWYLESLEAVMRQLPQGNITLIGHSLGAYLAMEYTKRHVRAVERLVLVAPAACTRRIPLSRAVYFSLPPQSIVRRGGMLGFLLFVWKYPRRPSYIRDRLRDFTYHLAVQTPPSGEAAAMPIIKFNGLRAECTRPLIENLELFDVPVQIVVGDTDSSMPVEGVHELFAEMRRRGFRVDLTVIEGGDHCPMLEKPEEFCHLLQGLAKPVKVGG